MPYTAGPFDDEHLYLQWGGKLPGGEEWSCGLRMAAAGASASTDPAGMIAAASDAVEAYHVRATTHTSQYAKLSFVKLNYLDTAGHYAEDLTYQEILADVAGGGSATEIYPNQVALVVSLTTGVTRGPAHRGRFYLPMPSMAMEATGLIGAAQRDQVKTSTDTFIAALNAINANYDVAVFSRKLGAPAHRLVTGVEVGRVLDTQRRRRRSLAETY